MMLSGAAQAAAPGPPLRSEIESRLSTLLERTGADVRVAVQGGEVVIQGQVPLLEHSLRAEQLVWQTPGVRDVDNELRVIPAGTESDEEIEHHVRLAVKGEPRFLDTQLEIGVSAGVVSLRGLFQDPRDVLALKHRIASIPGVLHVLIDAHVVAEVTDPSSGQSRALGVRRA